jgi:hypothetical protein
LELSDGIVVCYKFFFGPVDVVFIAFFSEKVLVYNGVGFVGVLSCYNSEFGDVFSHDWLLSVLRFGIIDEVRVGLINDYDKLHENF